MIRTPIIVRHPIVTPKELAWDDVYVKLVNYIKFASSHTSTNSNSSVAALTSPEDLFQEGQLVLYNCWLLYKDKPMDEFCAIFKTSLWRKLRSLVGRSAVYQVDIEDAYDLGYTQDVVEDMYDEYRLQQVVDLLKAHPIALTILREFINPSERTLWECEMDIARKKMLSSQGYNMPAPKSIQIRGAHIMRAMDMGKKEFLGHFNELRDAVGKVYKPEEDDTVTDEQLSRFFTMCKGIAANT